MMMWGYGGHLVAVLESSMERITTAMFQYTNNEKSMIQPYARFESVLGTIGSTPLIELNRLTSGLEGRILAKLEYVNPGFSKRDRMALQIIEDAEKSGELTHGQPVVELTSGNAGTGLAMGIFRLITYTLDANF